MGFCSSSFQTVKEWSEEELTRTLPSTACPGRAEPQQGPGSSCFFPQDRSLFLLLLKAPCGPSEAWAGAGVKKKNYNSQEAAGGPALGGDVMGAGAVR